jgi:hypothetical protein
MFARLAGQPSRVTLGFGELGTVVGYVVGVSAPVGKGQSKAARVGAALELAAKGALGLAADPVEEAEGAAVGVRSASSRALSTVSVAKPNAAATRGRGQGRIGLDRCAFKLL